MTVNSVRQILILLSLLCLATNASPAQAATVNGLSFQHGDWLLVCDNTMTCRAAGYQPDDDDRLPVSVLLTRAGGPQTSLSGQLMLGNYDAPPPPASLRLRINGQDLGVLSSNTADAAAVLTPAQVAALLKSLTRDSQILVIGSDKRQWQISDQGAAAALLKMDEFQGRLGTPGALVRKGARSEASVPEAIPLPVIKQVRLAATREADEKLATSAALRQALKATLQQDDCQDLSSDERHEALTVKRLNASKLLVSTQCWTGAYNLGFGYWVVNDRAPFQPQLVTTDASDEDDGTISAAQKGRGLGDCWSSQTWTWDGRRFVQTSKASTGLCRLVTPGGAWDLPTLATDLQP